MTIRNVTEAKEQLSALLVLVEGGEDVVISRAGKPIARLVALKHGAMGRKPGALKGKIKIGPDFDKAEPQIEALFNGEANDTSS